MATPTGYYRRIQAPKKHDTSFPFKLPAFSGSDDDGLMSPRLSIHDDAILMKSIIPAYHHFRVQQENWRRFSPILSGIGGHALMANEYRHIYYEAGRNDFFYFMQRARSNFVRKPHHGPPAFSRDAFVAIRISVAPPEAIWSNIAAFAPIIGLRHADAQSPLSPPPPPPPLPRHTIQRAHYEQPASFSYFIYFLRWRL